MLIIKRQKWFTLSNITVSVDFEPDSPIHEWELDVSRRLGLSFGLLLGLFVV